MRLFLIPVSTRRTLLYCQKIQELPSEKQRWMDKITLRATKLWAGWEEKDSGWQKAVVNYGNKALRRIPYEEWGLKSVPTLSSRRREEDVLGKEKHHIIFPKSLISTTRAPQILHTLATERAALHQSRLIWCLIGMPISAPFALVPIIPNLPFFYLVYRAWSHYRAIAGGKHLQWLLSKNFFTLSPSKTMDSFYSTQLDPSNRLEKPHSSPDTSLLPLENEGLPAPERLLLTEKSSQKLAKDLGIPALEVELERAVWQIKTSIRQRTEKAEKSSSPSEPEQPGTIKK